MSEDGTAVVLLMCFGLEGEYSLVLRSNLWYIVIEFNIKQSWSWGLGDLLTIRIQVPFILPHTGEVRLED